jgi:hypothetical protein
MNPKARVRDWAGKASLLLCGVTLAACGRPQTVTQYVEVTRVVTREATREVTRVVTATPLGNWQAQTMEAVRAAQTMEYATCC